MFAVLDDTYFVVALTDQDVVLKGPTDGQGFIQSKFLAYPQEDEITPPVDGQSLRPIWSPTEGLVWQADGRLLRSDGSELLSAGDGRWLSFMGLRFDGDQLVAVSGRNDRPEGSFLLGLYSSEGQPQEGFMLENFASIGGWLSATEALGNTSAAEFTRGAINTSPVLFDLEELSIHQVRSALVEEFGRNRIVAVMQGPFLRVANANGCLNVRERPSRTAEVVDCAADGVLLRDMSENRQVDGIDWQRVTTPASDQGWVSANYVTR